MIFSVSSSSSIPSSPVDSIETPSFQWPASRFARLILLKYLSNKLANLFFCSLKGLPSRCRRSIKAPRLPALSFYRRPQISPAFQTVEDRIESTGTQLVAVSAKLVDDPMSKDLLPHL